MLLKLSPFCRLLALGTLVSILLTAPALLEAGKK